MDLRIKNNVIKLYSVDDRYMFISLNNGYQQTTQWSIFNRFFRNPKVLISRQVYRTHIIEQIYPRYYGIINYKELYKNLK